MFLLIQQYGNTSECDTDMVESLGTISSGDLLYFFTSLAASATRTVNHLNFSFVGIHLSKTLGNFDLNGDIIPLLSQFLVSHLFKNVLSLPYVFFRKSTIPQFLKSLTFLVSFLTFLIFFISFPK